MDLLRDTIMIIGMPPEYHATLARWAKERNFKDQAHKVKPETIVEQVVLEYVDRMEHMEANLKPTDENAKAALAAPDSDSDDCSQLQICATSDIRRPYGFIKEIKMNDTIVDGTELIDGILDMHKNQKRSVKIEDDLKRRSGLNINFQSFEDRCYCCLRHISELNLYGGPDDSLVDVSTGEKLVVKFRSMCREDKESERIDQEAEDKYLADGFTNSNDWIVAKYGKAKLADLFSYFYASRTPDISMECRDCAVLDENDYFDKKERCFAEWSKTSRNLSRK